MKKRSKRYFNLSKNINREKSYNITEALEIIKNSPKINFIESVEAHVNLNIDPRKADQQIRATLNLPEGTGKVKKIAALVETDQFEEAKNSEADIIGKDELIDQIKAGVVDFDILITTPTLMPKLAKLGRILGPKGLMPSPKTGTITSNLKDTITEFKKGKIEYRNDKQGNIHLAFGSLNFEKDSLLKNLLVVFKSIEKNKPTTVKGKFFKKFTICSTMGPGISIDVESLKILSNSW